MNTKPCGMLVFSAKGREAMRMIGFTTKCHELTRSLADEVFTTKCHE